MRAAEQGDGRGVKPGWGGAMDLLELIVAYGEAMLDCGYFSDGSREQTLARERADRLLAEIEQAIRAGASEKR